MELDVTAAMKDIEATPDLLERALKLSAKKIMAAGLAGESPFDWDEVCRLAALPSFGVLLEVSALRRETENELG